MNHLAQIDMSRDFPYLGIDVYLTVRRVDDGSVALKERIDVRDLWFEGFDHVKGLRWADDHTVAFNLETQKGMVEQSFKISDD